MKFLTGFAILFMIACLSCNKSDDKDQYKQECPSNPAALRGNLRGAFLLPNGFTPNGDGRNDMLWIMSTDTAVIRSMQLRIIDSTGKLVNTIYQPAEYWDGVDSTTGKICAAGAYRVNYDIVMNGKGLSADSTLSGHTCLWIFRDHPATPGCVYAKDTALLRYITFPDQVDPRTLDVPYTTGENFCL